MSKRLLAVAAVLATAIFAVAAQAADPPPVAFGDPAGDNGPAPDIADVDVSNDAAGLYTFRVGLDTDYAADSQFWLYLDTDKNGATGDPYNLGADYVVYDDHASHTFDFAKWNGTDWDSVDNTTARFIVSTDSRQLTIDVNKSELGNSGAFNFFVISSDADGSDGHYDDAPSGTGDWSYAFKSPLSLKAVGAMNSVSRTEHAWFVALTALRSDTGAPVGSDGTISCSATAAGAKLKTLQQAFVSPGAGKGSAAVCVFRLPKKKHVAMTARLMIGYGGATVTKSVSAKS